MNITERYNNGATLNELAKSEKTSVYFIRKELNFNNAITRKPSESILLKSKDFNHDDYLNDVLIGELLGDGCIIPVGKSKHTGIFSYTTKHKKYIEWLYGILASYDIDIYGNNIAENKIFPRDNFTAKTTNISYKARTKSYVHFGEMYKMWYPNGKKIVPNSFIITPTVLLHWYLGDGSLSTDKANSGRGKWTYIYKNVRLHTNGFSYEQNLMLADKLKNIGLNFRVVKHTSNFKGNKVINWQLLLPKPTINNHIFFSFLPPCPDEIKEIYGYKWEWETTKIPRKII